MPERRGSEKRADGVPGVSALDRLVEAEERLERKEREARAEAETLVEEARREARSLLAGVEAELEGAEDELRARVRRESRPEMRAVADDAERRVGAWEGLSEEAVEELALYVLREGIRRQRESLSGGRV